MRGRRRKTKTMAEEFLRDHSGLRPFVLSDVQLTGTRIGGGAYGRVDEVAFPVAAAAKTIYAFLQEGDGTVEDLPKAASEFVKECQLMSTLRHPNIVQFLGVAFFPGSRLPALVMERLLTSLHDLLAPDTPPPRDTIPPLAFFSMALKCSVLQDVARALTHLYEQSPPIIHRDLSARNVLLNSGMVAKIADLGVARIAHTRAAVTMTKGPGASVYMPPEATAPATSNKEMSKYDASIDIFSLGVVTIFAIGENFPCDPLAATYLDEDSGLLVARTELQRRSEYMESVYEKLHACGQLRGDHPFIRLIEWCLHNGPHKRPSIHEVQHLLEEARACFGDKESKRNRRDLVRALQTQPKNQNLECVLQDLVTENADIQSRNQAKNRELAEAQQQLREKEEQMARSADIQSRMHRELAKAQQQLREKEEQLQSSVREKVTVQQQLTRKEAELMRAEETIRREQQHRETELAEAREQLRQKDEQLRSSEALVADFQRALDSQQQGTKAQSDGLATAVPHSIPATVRTGKLTVQCQQKKRAPHRMWGGSATTDSRFAYFTPVNSILPHQYECSTEIWTDLPPCPYFDPGLVIIDSELTTVGGSDGRSHCTNKLFTLTQEKWVEKYPPMNTACSRPAVVCTSDGDYLIVIGGHDGDDWTATVELFQMKSRRWRKLTDLPQSLQFTSATICGDHLNVIGDDGNGYSCSLQALPSSDRPITSPLTLTWKRLPRLPVTCSTVATLCGQLVIIGGWQDESPVNSIHQLVDEEWVRIGSMATSRHSILIASPSPDRIIIAGGVGAGNSVEECTVV